MADTPVQIPPASNLPPVAPPSAKFIIQLFLVPGLIVGTGVFLWLLWNWWTGSSYSTEKYLGELDNPNPEIRWRAAADLSQVLPRDAALASSTSFALDLTERLARTLEDSRVAEKIRAEQSSKARAPAPASTLEAEQNNLWYLIRSLGKFQVPVGAPLLQTIALDQKGEDAEAVFRRRLHAVDALTDLGANLKKFQQLPSERRQQILSDLREESSSRGERGRWATQALNCLEGGNEVRAVAETLCRLAHDPAPFLREHVIGALNYWDGPQVDETLLALTKDDGSGDEPITRPADQQQFRKDNPEKVRQRNQRYISYNAALTLARRGSPLASRLTDVYQEMLDVEKQEELARSQGPEQGAAEAEAVETVKAAINALARLHASGQPVPFLPAALSPLVESKNKSISAAAKELQARLK